MLILSWVCMTEKDLFDFDKRLSYAWLGGLIDGEGWVGIARNSYGPLQKAKSNHVLTPWTYHPVIAVQMTDQLTIIRIAEVTGYKREMRWRTKKNSNCRPVYRWRISDFEKTRVVLEMIRPYVITKKEQVEKLIEFMDNRQFKWRSGAGMTKRPMEDIEYCEHYYNLLRTLNLRGTRTLMQNQTNSTGRDQTPTCH